ncbi:hypothetical protein QN277_026721 [Acacia crassicarpa]|uniref:C3H1-type domain-containing protein n=1 Tax=Acacia crassicarpa TaxID=499986 RepID=A0AAE1MHN6_9FABA|nr:hypothetical protein QN277_026721 [Acacia crassicarpa]
MERFGRASDESQSDPPPEWTGTGGETGLEESMRQFGLAGEESYPQRPDEPDCIYYLKTGFCGYGSRCRFHHPRDRGAVIGASMTGVEYPERVGQPLCQYFMRTGSCKYGASCKYHHPRQGGGVAPVPLNYFGYPLRPDEKECSYYVKTGQCKFGTSCKFHHPQPAGVQVPAPLPVPHASTLPVRVPSPFYPTMQPPSGSSSQQYGVMFARPPLLPGSLVQNPYGPVVMSPVPFSGWNPYQAPTGPAVPSSTPSNVGSTQFYANTQLPSPAPAYSAPYQPLGSSFGPSITSPREQHSFPERPGQPECRHYMRTGECRFGPSCRYHHPPELIAPNVNVVLSPGGLPMRPGAPPCIHYAQRGVCKFGPACKFDHSMGALTYSPSASSLNMPVVSIPAGLSISSLAPSTSSSELQPELSPGSSEEHGLFRMSSSMSTSTGPVGLASSSGGTVSQSDAQTSTQSSASAATPTITTSSAISHTPS